MESFYNANGELLFSITNKINENSTNKEYPSAKAVYEATEKTKTNLSELREHVNKQKTESDKQIKDIEENLTTKDDELKTFDAKFASLKANVDTLNNGGLILKEDFIGRQVNGWLDEHPEATTTVQDNSLTSDKMNSELKAWIRSNAINVKDFGAVGDGVTDDTKAIKNAFATLKDYGYIVFPKGHYIVTPTSNKQSFIKLTGLKGITIDLNGSTVEVATNSYPNYNLFELIDCENFVITNGFLKGDRLTHDYTTTSGTHEFGYAIYCNSSLTSWYPNIGVPSETLKCCGVISNLKIFDFTGDGVVTKNGMSPGKIEVLNCEIHHCRRQGISVLDSDTVVVDNCHIHHIGTFDGISGASPMSGIDIEPGSGTSSVNLLVVRNTTIENTSNESIIAVTKFVKDTSGTITEIKTTIKSVEISNCNLGVVFINGEKDFDLNNRKNTSVTIENSTITYQICLATSRFISIRDGLFLNCTINAPVVYENNSPFSGGAKVPILQNCILNFIPDAHIKYVKLINSVVNGGKIRIHESSDATIRDCDSTVFNNCTFEIGNARGTYKFVGCSFRNCTPFTTSKPVKFRNCYFDSRYVPGADYVNCIIEDEIGSEA